MFVHSRIRCDAFSETGYLYCNQSKGEGGWGGAAEGSKMEIDSRGRSFHCKRLEQFHDYYTPAKNHKVRFAAANCAKVQPTRYTYVELL
jgi:hypothetical protein